MNDLNVSEIKGEVTALSNRLDEIKVVDQESLEHAAAFLNHIVDCKKRLEEKIGPVVKAAHDSHKRALALKKELETPLVSAEKSVKKSIADYHAEIRRKKEEEERKARLEAERIRKEEEERRLDEAVKLEEEGKTEEAEERLSKPPVEVKPVVTVKAPEKVDGVNVRIVYGFEIEDIDKLPRAFMIPNDSMIGSYVRQHKDHAKIPGVKVTKKESVVVRN